jgi:hypothetical protein
VQAAPAPSAKARVRTTWIAGLLIYTGSFAIGLGLVFWLLVSEVYPVKIRGRALRVATIANWGRQLRGDRLFPDDAERDRQ